MSNWNWKVVRQFLKQSFDLGLSRSSCLNYLHRLGFVLKRPKKRLLKAKDEERKAFIIQYSQIREEAESPLYEEEAEDLLHQLDGSWNAHVVWTGSYNLSENAGQSWENALIIRDPVIAGAYLNEWSQLFTFSEPLDWRSEYIAPEWRIGS